MEFACLEGKLKKNEHKQGNDINSDQARCLEEEAGWEGGSKSLSEEVEFELAAE